MEWNKYRIKTTTEAEDYVAGMLMELGITGVQIEDNVQISEEDKKAQFIDYLADLPEDDGTAYVSFYTAKARDNRPEEAEMIEQEDQKLLESIRTKLKEANSFLNVGEGSIEKSSTKEEDWINNWKKYFKAFTVENFYIKPSWQKVEPQYKDYKLIEIDPGTAFGTGKHDTTQLCISGMVKYIKDGDSVLDIGCGSGILSLVAKKLGASHVDMSDIDPAAITASHDNFHMNNEPTDDIEIVVGDIISDDELKKHYEDKKYDVVVANILADVIIPIAGFVDRFLKPGGLFISSGIIYMKEDDVIETVNNNKNLEIVEVRSQGDWRSVIARRK